MRAVRRDPNICMCSLLYVPLLALVLWTAGFVLTRVELFHEALRSEELKRERETWLRQECRKPEFYAHMKHHSALCDEVEVHAKGSLYLAAVIHLVQNTYLCGYVPCATAMDLVLDWMGGHVTLFVGAAVVLLLLPTLLLPFYREHANHVANKYIDSHHNAPYREHSFYRQQYCITPLGE
jgi:hypothetical protein